MKPSVRTAQHLLGSAERRYSVLATGFSAASLSLAGEDEEVEYARILVEDAIEIEGLPQLVKSYRL